MRGFSESEGEEGDAETAVRRSGSRRGGIGSSGSGKLGALSTSQGPTVDQPPGTLTLADIERGKQASARSGPRRLSGSPSGSE